MKPLLSVENLSVSYGAIQALRSVNLEVPRGKIVAILGANGGGKTTLLKKISGLVPAVQGTVTFKDQDITGISAEAIAQAGIVQAPEGRQIFGELTVKENLQIGAFTVKDAKQREQNLQRVYRYFPVLEERSSQIAQTLSGGEQQMLAIGRALMASPEILILDEPSLGLAPLIVRDIFAIIQEIRENGTTVLIVEQNAMQTLKIADFAYVLQVGSMVKSGTAQTLREDPELIEAYLGT
ncbi:ABC transporter ATP-binding protein [Salinispira pacifica]|uniref:Branched-chain amino acid transport ATP-binding protein LivF n=1 Tax=Salinispira pacifica TaxID=1307761 RepID=V5WFY2_9SPIO|nr:ABC transporter ATP-binding protein [Salinispira pacifica]AHC14061.1 Branched-chain amino acid transport ATP-binding protein LivF [Salinispira pacifica]